MIRVERLSKSYGTKQVLKDISLDFSPGNIYGIVGRNGAGKTTLFRSLAGLETSKGKISSSFPVLKNQLGFLPTEPVFMPRITGWEYLKLMCLARKVETEDFESQNIFDLPLNQYAETYSTGMKKKLALMGVLLQKNDVFILDEPFNGVDIQSNIIIEALIQKLRSAGKTILISSHIFSTLSNLCDEIHLLSEGTIVQSERKGHFHNLEKAMKEVVLGNEIDKMNIL